MEPVYHIRAVLFVLLALFGSSSIASGKGNEPYYQDPFDLAAGGASLTRASRAGRIFANPALTKYGGRFSLWLGSTTSVFVNNGICQIALSPCPLSSDSGSAATAESSDDTSAGAGGIDTEVLDLAFREPFRLGLSQSFAWITSHFGFAIFSRNEIDLDADKVGPGGTPNVRFSMESYSGVQLAAAMRSPVRWFSFGGAVRALVSSEPQLDLGIEVVDQLSGSGAQDFFQDQLQSNFAPFLGFGLDIGTLFFFQGRHIDYSFALKADDVGGTQLAPISGASSAGENTVTSGGGPVKQVVSAGSGLTLHNSEDQVHLSLDYRDLLDAHQDPMFKKIYAGIKMTLRQYVGIAAGIHHGYLSAGLEIDLILAQLSLATYKRELSDKPGVNPRRYYLLTFSMGG